MGCSSDNYLTHSYNNVYNPKRQSSFRDKKPEDNRNIQSNFNDNKIGFGLGFQNGNDNKFNFHDLFNISIDSNNDNDFKNNIHQHRDFCDNERMFNDIDRNNNSVLSKNEIMDGFNLNPYQAEQLFDKMDLNGDGIIDRQEFSNYMNNNF